MKSRSCLGLVLALACNPAEGPTPAPLTCAAGEVLDGETCVPETCGTGAWGNLPVDGDTVYVDAAGADGGDGSDAAPFVSIQDGVDLAAALDGALVVVAAGTYVENISMGDGYRDIDLQGRCKELVTIDGSEGDEVPTVEIAGDRKRPVVAIRGFTVTGGSYSGVRVSQADLALSASAVSANEVVGVLIASGAAVNLDGVDITGTTPDRHDDYGRGLDVTGGASLTATDCVVQGNSEIGLYGGGAGVVISLEDTQVLGTVPSPNGSSGLGLEVTGGATLSATGCTIQHNADEGVFASGAGTVVTLVDTQILDTVPTIDGLRGRGIEVNSGAELNATGCSIEDSTDMGVYGGGADTVITLVDTDVLDTLPSSQGSFGIGLAAGAGAVVAASGGSIQGNTGLGAYVGGSGAFLTLVDVDVLDTHPSPDGANGGGIVATEGASLVVSGGSVVNSASVGVFVGDAATVASLDQVDIRDTTTLVDGTRGYGLEVDPGATLSATGCTVQGSVAAGVLVGGAGTTATLVDTDVFDTATSPNGDAGYGIMVSGGGTLTASSCGVHDSASIGVVAKGTDTVVSLFDTEVRGTEANPDGSNGVGLAVVEGGTLAATGCTVEKNEAGGALATGDGANLTLVDTRVLHTQRGRSSAFAFGVGVQEGAVVELADGEISGTEGPGLYIATGGVVEASGLAIDGNQLAGVVLIRGEVTLTAVTIVNTLPDAEWGGGIGVYANNLDGTPTLSLLDSTIGPHDYAAIWLDGQGAYTINGSSLSGSAGVAAGAATLHGNAVFAENGVTSWDGVSGLSLVDNTFADASQIGVLLDASSATLAGNSWSDNGTDLRQQSCEGMVPLADDDVLGVPVALVCPPSNTLTAYDFVLNTLYLQITETAE